MFSTQHRCPRVFCRSPPTVVKSGSWPGQLLFVETAEACATTTTTTATTTTTTTTTNNDNNSTTTLT